MLNDLYFRLRSLFRRAAVDEELNEELQFHLEQQTEKYQRAGLSADEARRKAKLEFGGLGQVKEECREARGITFVETMMQDLRYGLRMLGKSPGFTTVVVLTLALGIGANTAIFSIVDAVLLQSLPVRNPEQLVILQWRAHSSPNNVGMNGYSDCEFVLGDSGASNTGCSLAYPMFEEVKRRTNLFAGATAFAGPAQLDLSGNGPASMAQGELVSGSYFETLGVGAALGRTLRPEDDRPGATAVAVLDYGYWQGMFGGSAGVLGRTVRLNNSVFTIVGVTDRSFSRLTPGKSVDLWVALAQAKVLVPQWSGESDASSWWLTVVGRLRPGVTRTQAQAPINLLFVNEALHGTKPKWKSSDEPSLELLPAQDGLTGIRDDFGKPLILLMSAVGIVLLIACANVAGLMLARGASREKELAVRMAIGAGRMRVVRQLLTESLLLSCLGACVGAVFAYWGAKGLAQFFADNAYSPLRLDLHLSLPVMLFTIGATLLTGLGCGLVPALRGARANVAAKLKGNSRTMATLAPAGRWRFGAGSGLVVLQVALSMLVLTGAALLLRTLGSLRNTNPGFDTHNVLLFSVEPSLAGFKKTAIQTLYKNLQQRLAAVPGVMSVSYSSSVLLGGGLWTQSVGLEGQTGKDKLNTQMLAVGPDFFATMRIPVALGRPLFEADMAPKRSAALVNRAFVRKFVGGRNPIGLHFGPDDPATPKWEIVGVVADTKYATLRDVEAPTAYVPLRDRGASFSLRTAVAPTALTSAVRQVVDETDHNLPVIRLTTQTETIDRLLFNERLLARLFGLFGALGLALACLGLFGLLSYEVARGTRELGIRTALGAQRRDILLLVVRQGLTLVICGAFAGTGAALGATRLLESLLYNVRPTDPATFAEVAALLIAIGLVACGLPARRATRVDPLEALRYE